MTLFTSYRLGPVELANRIVMAPMTRSRALGGVPNELMRDYYAQRATAGLIVTEGIAPPRTGWATPGSRACSRARRSKAGGSSPPACTPPAGGSSRS